MSGRSLAEAEENLREAVCEEWGDVSPIFEYSPRLPLAGLERELGRHDIVAVAGVNERHIWTNSSQELFVGGICPVCKLGQQDRSEQPLRADLSLIEGDSAFLVAPARGPFGSDAFYVFSEDMVRALAAGADSTLEWREVIDDPAHLKSEAPGRKTRSRLRNQKRRRFYEPIERLVRPFVFVKYLCTTGLGCDECGKTKPSPYLRSKSGMWYYVLEDDIISIPPLFLAGGLGNAFLCLRDELWQNLQTNRSWKGVASLPIGVVPRHWSDDNPQLSIVRKKSSS